MSITRRERKRKGVKSMDRNKKEPCGDMALIVTKNDFYYTVHNNYNMAGDTRG